MIDGGKLHMGRKVGWGPARIENRSAIVRYFMAWARLSDSTARPRMQGPIDRPRVVGQCNVGPRSSPSPALSRSTSRSTTSQTRMPPSLMSPGGRLCRESKMSARSSQSRATTSFKSVPRLPRWTSPFARSSAVTSALQIQMSSARSRTSGRTIHSKWRRWCHSDSRPDSRRPNGT